MAWSPGCVIKQAPMLLEGKNEAFNPKESSLLRIFLFFKWEVWKGGEHSIPGWALTFASCSYLTPGLHFVRNVALKSCKIHVSSDLQPLQKGFPLWVKKTIYSIHTQKGVPRSWCASQHLLDSGCLKQFCSWQSQPWPISSVCPMLPQLFLLSFVKKASLCAQKTH